MTRTVFRWFSAMLVTFSIGGVLLTSITPQFAFAADSSSCDKSFLGFPTWSRGLASGADCTIEIKGDNLSSTIWHIVLNCIEIALVAVIYLATFYILYAGFMLIVNSGNSDIIAKSRQTILNAVIGLLLSIASVAIVNLIAGII